MHPNAFLKTYWRLDLLPQIFVAMSFSERYNKRYTEIVEPAITSIHIDGKQLSAHRVDASKSGDSILTDILEGIAHSQLVIADLSVLGHDSATGDCYRNGNVMYEVGLALACRQPQEVLLIRDDRESFLFDVSTIPHMHIDFSNVELAKETLSGELLARLRERSYFNDARVQIAISQLTAEEVAFLKDTFGYERNTAWGNELRGLSNWWSSSTARLLDKQVIQIAGEFDNGNTAFMFTDLGWVIQQRLKGGLRQFKAPNKNENSNNEDPSV